MFHASRYPITTYLCTLLHPEPSTYKQASTKPEWLDAMTSEYKPSYPMELRASTRDLSITML